MSGNSTSIPCAGQPSAGLRNRWLPFLLALLLGGMAVVASPSLRAATVVVVNNNAPNQGFNDPTVAAPVGGNVGTTVGAQRLIAFQFAADIWGGLLSSAVPIRVGAQFSALTCDAFSAVLGSAGPNTVFRDFAGAPVTATWYPAALANALSGTDNDPPVVAPPPPYPGDDISANFNSNIGTPGCLSSSGWYYGLDANPPGGKIDFVSTLLHELGHGLGFLTFTSLASGAKLAGFNDTFMRNLEDHGATPPDYPSMTDAQRVTASKDTGNLHWVGANVRAVSGVLAAGKVGDHVRMYAPNPQQAGSSVSHWDTALTPNQVMEPSYTGPLHNPALELQLFKDIGWNLAGVTPYALNVSKAGTGTGTVSSSPAGISCGATCSASYTSGTAITLTAAATTGTFIGWSGYAGCSSANPCIFTMPAAPVNLTATFNLASGSSNLINLSTRGQVQTGANVMIGGFIISGATAKTVLIRARGPSLAAFGVPGVLADPTISLYSGSTVIASNDNWGSAANAAAINATGFAPTDPSESAILTTLSPGPYTAIVSGVGGTTGVGIVEVLEIDNPASPLSNISTRGSVQTGANVLIGGFIISGATPKTVLIRARGPSMAPPPFNVPGVLADPMMSLYSGSTVIASNDNWGSAANAAAINATGMAPTDSLESAILITLSPGPYTVIVSGVGGTSGVGIVEVVAQ